MLKYLIIFLIVFWFFKGHKYNIRWETILKKGLPKLDTRSGNYLFNGKQGSGKSYVATFLTYNLIKRNKDLVKIKSNVKSLKIPGAEIEYFDKLEDVYYDTEQYVIYYIDEVARKYDRNSKCDKQFYAFLNQSRKMHRVVMLITQEYRELPMWLRRPIRYVYTTNPTRILNWFGFYTTTMGDGENLVFDKDEGEYLCPDLKYIIYRRNQFIANMYDTFEAVNSL